MRSDQYTAAPFERAAIDLILESMRLMPGIPADTASGSSFLSFYFSGSAENHDGNAVQSKHVAV